MADPIGWGMFAELPGICYGFVLLMPFIGIYVIRHREYRQLQLPNGKTIYVERLSSKYRTYGYISVAIGAVAWIELLIHIVEISTR